MCAHLADRDFSARRTAARRAFTSAFAVLLASILATPAAAESKGTKLIIRSLPATSDKPRDADPIVLKAEPSVITASPRKPLRTARPAPVPTPLNARRPIEQRKTIISRKPAVPVVDGAQLKQRPPSSVRQVRFQPQPQLPPQEQPLRMEPAQDPCAAIDEKPLYELGIGIALSEGKRPDEPAAACWEQINQSAGPLAAARCWPMQMCNWDATCLCHRPLYFEQINLERHGYGCCEAMQPLASAAHFFATVPALPYCMAAECPCECVYTLGHYRPGSCPPWRHHWPPCSPLAAVAAGGFWTGMVFLIP
jgi:hypothetical protein